MRPLLFGSGKGFMSAGMVLVIIRFNEAAAFRQRKTYQSFG